MLAESHPVTVTTSVRPIEVVEPAPVLVDTSAAHQINLTWATQSKQETVVLCNCGWVGTRTRPEVLGSVQRLIAEYEGHLVEAGFIQRELS